MPAKKIPKLMELAKKNINDIFGEKAQELTFEEEMHLLNKKINNCEIKEKIKLNIKLKNPNQSSKYEYSITDEEGNIIGKSEKTEGQKEIILCENSEMDYSFTKRKGITITIIKHINDIERITTKKTISLQKLFSSENYEEKIDNFSDNELIDINYDLPEEKKDEKYICINFK